MYLVEKISSNGTKMNGFEIICKTKQESIKRVDNSRWEFYRITRIGQDRIPTLIKEFTPKSLQGYQN